MYQRALIILAILAAAAVAFAVVLLTGRGAGAPIGSALLERSVFGAEWVEITPVDGEPIRFERTAQGWALASDGWPASDTAVRGALRLLGELTIEGGSAAPGDRESQIVLGFEDGERAAVWIEPSARAVGGGAVVRDGLGRFARAPVGLAQAVETITQDAWRSPAALPKVEIEASRVAIEGESSTLELARVDGRWFVRSPERAKADDRAVAGLLGAMIDLRATRFGGEPVGPASTALRAVRVDQDRRVLGPDGEVRVDTESSELRVLGAADDSGAETVVESKGVRMAVRTDRLSALLVDPTSLVSRAAASAAPSDVGMIVLRGPGGEIAFRRQVLEWRAMGADATRLLDPSEESGGMERLLAFLANASAERVEFVGDSAPADAARFIQLFGLGDAPLATIAVRTNEGGGVTLLDATGAGVARMYGDAQTPPLLRAWLQRD